MRIGIVVNDLATEKAAYTTTLLARKALTRGHEVHYINVVDFSFLEDNTIGAIAVAVEHAESPDAFVAALQRPEAVKASIAVDDLDVLFLRNEPSFDAAQRSWAQPIGYLFGSFAQAHGVTVLSDPAALARSVSDKMYTQVFPQAIRPKTVISRQPDAILKFIADTPGGAILKPLHGGAGHSVFLTHPQDPNAHQIYDAVSLHGYVVAQEYLPAAAEGVVRLFMLDGRPLTAGGKCAVMKHVPAGADIRSNYRVSGSIAPAEMTAGIESVAAATGPHLAADGHFLVGLDIVGDKLLEANLFSPGGLRRDERLHGVSFSDSVLKSMEEHRASGLAARSK